MDTMTRQSLRAAVGFAIAATLIVGCAAGNASNDKAGGSGEPLVLTMATVNGDLDFTPQIQYLVNRVEELSEGDLKIEMAYEVGEFAAYAEQEVVRGVADGEFDLGFVGTQVFESLGFDNFRALVAPMLIDSYKLEASVISSGIPDEMMEGIDEVGVTGLEVLGGALRKPVAVKQPLLAPADWRGITFGVAKSETQAEAVRTLAASPLEVIGDSRDEALEKGSIDGFESSLLAYAINGQQRAAPYVTANVNLWPQTLAVMGNPGAVAGLSETRRDWLQQATDEAAARSTELTDTDADTVAGVCEAGGRFASASTADLGALQRNFEAAYVALEKDIVTTGFIEQIQALKKTTSAEPPLEIPEDCTREPPKSAAETGDAPPLLNGTYRYEITLEEAKDADMVDAEDEYPQVTTVTLHNGELEGGCFGNAGGTYSIKGDQVTFSSIQYEATATVTFDKDDDGSLRLTPVPPLNPGDAFVCFSQVWIKID